MTIEFGDPTMLAPPINSGVTFYNGTSEALGELPGFSDRSYMGILSADSLASAGEGSRGLRESIMASTGQSFQSQPQLGQLGDSANNYAYSLCSDLSAPLTVTDSGSATNAMPRGGYGITSSNDVLTPTVGPPEANETEDSERDGEDIVITGRRISDPGTGGGTATGGGGSSGGGGIVTGGGGSTGGEDGGGTGGGEPGGNDCRDRNALAAALEIKAEPDDSTKEHGSIVYKAGDGSVRHSPPIQGGFTQIPLDAVEKWLADNGVSHSQVIGFVHNHPTYSYGGTDKAVSINSYPSQNDWGFADYMVAKGAGGAGGSGFALYVINPDKELREFHYSDGTVYRNFTTSQKENEVGLPVQLVSDGTSCL